MILSAISSVTYADGVYPSLACVPVFNAAKMLLDARYHPQVGFRFYRRVHLCPGLSLNLSRSGPSLSLGVRGAHVTVGRRGVTKTVGVPGTGIFYTSRQGYHTGYHSAKSDVPLAPDAHVAAARHAEGMLIAVVGLLFLVLIVAALLRS